MATGGSVAVSGDFLGCFSTGVRYGYWRVGCSEWLSPLTATDPPVAIPDAGSETPEGNVREPVAPVC